MEKKFKIITPKQYMLETDVKLQFDKGEILNKYSRRDIIKDQSLNAIELTIYSPTEGTQVAVKCDFKEGTDGETQENNLEKYNFYWCEEDLFYRKFTTKKGGDIKPVTPKIIEKTVMEPKQPKKENFKMNLSLGTWFLLIIAMIVVAKVAHKISLKTIFSPTKKTVKHIEKEWKDS